LAVGTNGETLVADSSTSTGLRYQSSYNGNGIINGGMDIWQRGTSISLAASAGTTYVADRWATGTGANQACTVSRQATGDTTNLPNIQYALRFQRNSGQTGTGGMGLTTSLETINTIPFAGKTVTYSFYARKGADYAPGTFNGYLITGTGTDQNRQNASYTGENSTIMSAISLTTTWQRFVITGTIPTNATEMAPYFFFDWSGTAGAADYFEVTGFQIDLGTYTASTAPAFRRSGGTIQGELAACQRYYYRANSVTHYGLVTGFGAAYLTTACEQPMILPVTMRTTSTTIDFSQIVIFDAGGASYASPLAVTVSAAAPNIALIRVTFSTGVLTQYRATYLAGNNNTAAYLGISAEL
jgi:hypothetical protein